MDMFHFRGSCLVFVVPLCLGTWQKDGEHRPRPPSPEGSYGGLK